MNLENTTLSKTDQTQRTNVAELHLHEAPTRGKFIEKEAECKLPGAGEEGLMWTYSLMGTVTVWADGKTL